MELSSTRIDAVSRWSRPCWIFWTRCGGETGSVATQTTNGGEVVASGARGSCAEEEGDESRGGKNGLGPSRRRPREELEGESKQEVARGEVACMRGARRGCLSFWQKEEDDTRGGVGWARWTDALGAR